MYSDIFKLVIMSEKIIYTVLILFFLISGYRLGLIQVKLALICLLSKYELNFCEETLNPMKMDNLWIVNRAKGDLILNLRKISS